jgi:hypothetical protein
VKNVPLAPSKQQKQMDSALDAKQAQKATRIEQHVRNAAQAK